LSKGRINVLGRQDNNDPAQDETGEDRQYRDQERLPDLPPSGLLAGSSTGSLFQEYLTGILF
jgi:hypothetical protein